MWANQMILFAIGVEMVQTKSLVASPCEQLTFLTIWSKRPTVVDTKRLVVIDILLRGGTSETNESQH